MSKNRCSPRHGVRLRHAACPKLCPRKRACYKCRHPSAPMVAIRRIEPLGNLPWTHGTKYVWYSMSCRRSIVGMAHPWDRFTRVFISFFEEERHHSRVRHAFDVCAPMVSQVRKARTSHDDLSFSSADRPTRRLHAH